MEKLNKFLIFKFLLLYKKNEKKGTQYKTNKEFILKLKKKSKRESNLFLIIKYKPQINKVIQRTYEKSKVQTNIFNHRKTNS